MLHILYQETLGVLAPLYFHVALKVWRKKIKDHEEVLCLILHKKFCPYVMFPIVVSSRLLNVSFNRAWDSMKLCVCYCKNKVSWKSGLLVLIFAVLNILMWKMYDSLQVLRSLYFRIYLEIWVIPIFVDSHRWCFFSRIYVF